MGPELIRYFAYLHTILCRVQRTIFHPCGCGWLVCSVVVGVPRVFMLHCHGVARVFLPFDAVHSHRVVVSIWYVYV